MPSMEKAAITVSAEPSQIGYFNGTISEAGKGSVMRYFKNTSHWNANSHTPSLMNPDNCLMYLKLTLFNRVTDLQYTKTK